MKRDHIVDTNKKVKIPNPVEVKIHIRYHLINGRFVDLTLDSDMKHIIIPQKDKAILLRVFILMKRKNKIEAELRKLSKSN